MKKHRPRKSSILNSSVSTYGRTKLRNIEDDLRWFGIQDCKKKKGLFSDSDNSDLKSKISPNFVKNDAIYQRENKKKKRLVAKRTSKKKLAKRKSRPEKENAFKPVHIAAKSCTTPNSKMSFQQKDSSFELPVKKVKRKPYYKPVFSDSSNDDCSFELPVNKVKRKPYYKPVVFDSSNDSSLFTNDAAVDYCKTVKYDCKTSFQNLIKPCSVTLNDIKPELSSLSKSSNVSTKWHKSNFSTEDKPSPSLSSCCEQYQHLIKPCSVELNRCEISLKGSLLKSDFSCESGLLFDGKLKFSSPDENSAERLSNSPKEHCPRRSLSFETPNCKNSKHVNRTNNSNSISFFNHHRSFVALHSSKKQQITNKRRRRRCDFKITDGLSTFSFSEAFKEPQESINLFQHSIITGHPDSNFNFRNIFLQSFDNCHNTSDSNKVFIQSTPLIKSQKNPFPTVVTPFPMPKNCSSTFNGFPLSSTPSLNDVSSYTSKHEKICFDLSSNYNQDASSFENESLKRRLDDLSLCANKVLSECNQVVPRLFENLNYEEDTCRKLGEGVYGEVYRCCNSAQTAVAVKVIPVNGKDLINKEKQKTFSEILPEIVNSTELSRLSEGTANRTDSFIQLFGIHCVTGKYPSYLLNAWDNYRNERGTENDRPDIFPLSQHYIVFEFNDGGIDLEHFNFRNAGQALSILQQTIAGLAVAEEVYQFEHRDLHWGNILVESTRDIKLFSFNLAGVTKEFPCVGVVARIIDFTFSRMTKGELSLYHDLSPDVELFTGESNVDYQFEIYRMMKNETGNDWSLYKPKTNVFWVHYLLHKFLNKVNYRLQRSKLHSNAMKKLQSFNKFVLDYDSCSQIVMKSALFCT